MLNGLKVVNKQIGDVKLVCSGAGAAAIACLDLMVKLGIKRSNIFVVDSRGVIREGREENMEPNKARYAQKTDARTLADVCVDADVFLGCSAPGVLTADMVKTMAASPLILALANPEPEIRPEVAKAARPDCIIATGRSDYPNQVNNVLCFPFIFRGALDCGATVINEEMKLACVKAIAELAQAEQNDEVAMAYAGQDLSFGPDYIIPKPFDSRLIVKIAPAIAEAAAASGVARRPIEDLEAYRQKLMTLVYHTGQLMRPLFQQAKSAPKRVIYADGEDERVLRAAQTVVDENIARPILVGRPTVIDMRIKKFGLRLAVGRDIEIVDPEDDARFNETWSAYYKLKGRDGVTPDIAKAMIRKHNSLIGVMLLQRGDADAMICGVSSRFDNQLKYVDEVIGLKPGVKTYAAMNVLMLPTQTLFICDTHVNEDPTAEQIADMTIQAAAEMQRFGIVPKIALLSHSNFGSSTQPSALRMKEALALIRERAPGLDIDGEMHGDLALDAQLRRQVMPRSTLTGEANLLVMPGIDAANISYNLLKTAAGHNIAIGPVLLGAAKPVHILTPAATVRRIVNMTAWIVVDVGVPR